MRASAGTTSTCGRMNVPGCGDPMGMTDRPDGIPADALTDDDLRRELAHLHETRHDTVLAGSESALENHTRRMFELEAEFLRRLPGEAAPDPMRTRAGSRSNAAGSPG